MIVAPRAESGRNRFAGHGLGPRRRQAHFELLDTLDGAGRAIVGWASPTNASLRAQGRRAKPALQQWLISTTSHDS